MVKENFSMQVEVVGSADSKETYEVRRQWQQGLGKAIVIEIYPTISVSNPMILDISSLHLLNTLEPSDKEIVGKVFVIDDGEGDCCTMLWADEY